MKSIAVGKIAEIVAGTLAWGEEKKLVSNVSIDSRDVDDKSLFVPIIGERVDAHRFIPDVLERDALVFSSDWSVRGERGACIYVEDTLLALQRLALWYRGQFDIPVIGITGSVGKTTTKEMVASVLEKKYRTVRTIGNRNSQIGLSLMMFELEEDTEMAVFEMGISLPGEMERLADIARPTAAVVTNIGVSHIGNLGSRENICREKGKIIRHFTEGNPLYICGNGDLRELSRQCIPYDRACTFYYGTEDGNDYGGGELSVGESGQGFVYRHGDVSEPVRLSVMGRHNVDNAILALALAERFSVPLRQAADALSSYRPIAMRGVVMEKDGVHIIDDTYNASPDSIKSNLKALACYPGGGKIAVLGDVLELGGQSAELHRDIGRFIVEEAAAGRRLSLLVTVGSEMLYTHTYVEEHSDILTLHCDDREEAVQAVTERMKKGDWILVKGSRGMHMEEVAERLAKE